MIVQLDSDEKLTKRTANRIIKIAASSVTSTAAYASSSRRAPPAFGRPTGRLPGAAVADPGALQPPGTAVAEPGARPQRGRRRSACIAHRALLPVKDGGVRAAERATPRARQGPRLAPRRVVVSNAACRPAQGSIRLVLGLGLRPSAPAPPAIAAGYAPSNTGCFKCTRTTRACSRCVTMTQDFERAGWTTVTRALICDIYYGHAK